MLVSLVAIQAAALSIFLFEWFSPAGHPMKVWQNYYLNINHSVQESPTAHEHKFSLFRTYWLVWAVLFQASVQVDCPKGLTARFMSSIWALFAVVFLAIYTANLAAFMIPRKEYHDLSGIEDTKISNPYSQEPPLQFTTIPYSHSHVSYSYIIVHYWIHHTVYWGAFKYYISMFWRGVWAKILTSLTL